MKLSHKHAALSRPRSSLVCVPAGVCACCDVDAILNENSAVLLSLSHCLSRCLLLSALFLFRPVLAPSFPPRPLYTALTPSLQMPLRSRATIAMQVTTECVCVCVCARARGRGREGESIYHGKCVYHHIVVSVTPHTPPQTPHSALCMHV